MLTVFKKVNKLMITILIWFLLTEILGSNLEYSLILITINFFLLKRSVVSFYLSQVLSKVW